MSLFTPRAPHAPQLTLILALGLTLGLAPAAAHAQVGTPVDTTATAAGDSATAAAAAADTMPRPIRPQDYGQWESLDRVTLAPDGSWLAVGIGRVNDEDELRIRRVGSDSVVVIGYGSLPAFSADGRWLAYLVGQSADDRERARKAKKPVQSRMGLLDLVEGDTTLIAGVASFTFSDDGRYLAMRRYPAPRSGNGNGNGPEHGADIVVRDLRSGTDTNFGNVGEFAWQDDRSVLAMTVDAIDNAGNGVRLWDAASGAIRVLDSHVAEYRELRWRDDEDDLLVLRSIEDEDRKESTHAVLVWHDVHGRTRSHTFDPTAHPDFPADTRIVELRRPDFSEDGRAVFFGVKEWELTDKARAAAEAADSAGRTEEAPGDSTTGSTGSDRAPGESPRESARRDTASASDSAGVEVWHSRDVEILPRQKRSALMDRRRNHLAVWHLDDDRFVHLGSDFTSDVTRVHGDRLAIGVDMTPYDQDRMFGPEYRDVYLIDTRTGERRKVLERIEYFYGASPEGRFLLYLLDDHYRVYSIRDDRRINLTDGVPTVFVDTADDHTVVQKPPFRYAGWTDGDRSVILHDQYDAWEVRPDGSGGRRLTDGRPDSVVHRYNRVGWDEDQRSIDPRAPAYWNLTGQWSKRNGYAVSPRLDRSSQRRIWLDASVSRLVKAEDADVFGYVVAGFDDSPDVFVARDELGDGIQVTRTNPFHDRFLWGHSELVEFRNTRGQRLQGALFYPAGWEPGKKYPMITYIYEIRSPAVHSYSIPSERSAYNTAVWTSQGYFVFQPDIVYRDRNPGLSAVEALVPAVETVLATGMVDPERVGLVGHSWGGYQTAFVPTQTDLFAAAVAGAPLTELTSMYLSIYWNFGGTDARIFEISQGRMEVPPWEDLDSYHANSPVHQIESLDTPMLVAFGDEDGAVDWDQGIVFYNAARRAGKDMVLLVYEGENHGLSKKPNQIDYHRRINQWFAHYLKGEPAPEWMTTGVPYLEQQEGKAAPAAQQE